MLDFIHPDGLPTTLFNDTVLKIVDTWLEEDKEQETPVEFLVPGVIDKDNKITYWGVIDIPNIPQEDLYLAVQSRFYCALRTLGQVNVIGLALFDIQAVIDREPPPKP